ncbi:EI24 [Mytilus coruscus]|uniref:EI24 n=1 Tax=Mytilus coruscus TaxID=42192 RepID=A0A6J8C5F7_MYTCO|nr:EI24 [Mytilus coruscus]
MTDLLKDILYGIIHGFRDSILGTVKIFKLDNQNEEEESDRSSEPMTTLARRRAEKRKDKSSSQKQQKNPRVLQRLFLCCGWNGGIFLASILLFNYVLIPVLQWFTELIFSSSGTEVSVWSYMVPVLSWTFSALWILPLFVLSKIVNCFWFQDIADAAYVKSRGKPQLLYISTLIADMSFSLLIQALFLIQSTAASFLPIPMVGTVVGISTAASFLPIPMVGTVVGIVHMCLLHSLYSFEYKWFNMGWEVHKRLQYIENRWPYFCGFGLPLALVTSFHPSVVISGCLFSILFPLFIVSANEAEEPQQNFDFPLKLFSLVVSISNSLYSSLFRKPGTTSKPKESTSQQSSDSRSSPRRHIRLPESHR